jgi:GT2 family glycosyltransferase
MTAEIGSPCSIAVVIVSFNSAKVISECLASLRRQSPPVTLSTVVVDNGSRDGTKELVRREFPEVRLIEAPRNGGFSYGTNIGLRALGVLDSAQSSSSLEKPFDYVLFLNADTELPPGVLASLVEVLDERPDVGALTPRLVRRDGSLDQACRRSFPTVWNSLSHLLGLDRRWPGSSLFGRYNLSYRSVDEPMVVECVAGAFMLVRTEAVMQIGAWDESFFAYGEDIDYCLRLYQAGWLIWYEARVTVLHHKGAISQQRSLMMLREFYRAMEVYYRKHHAARSHVLVRALVTGGIKLFYAAALLRQLLRPARRRWVGAAHPIADKSASR